MSKQWKRWIVAGGVLALAAAFAGATDGSDGRASAVLEREHDAILMVANALQSDVAALRRGESVAPQRLRKALDFFRNFADACHHRKEEAHYFPAVERSGGAAQELWLSELRQEHARFRTLLDAIESGLEAEGTVAPSTAEPLAAYLAEVTEHIRMENEIVFAGSAPWLGPEEDEALRASFREVEAALGPDFHERYHRLALELAGKRDPR